jgi:hypothetical protein
MDLLIRIVLQKKARQILPHYHQNISKNKNVEFFPAKVAKVAKVAKSQKCCQVKKSLSFFVHFFT